MNAPLSPAWRVGALVALVLLAAAAYPWAFYLSVLQVPLGVAVGVIGWLPRRRVADGLWLALPVLAAQAVEAPVGPWAMACAVLPVYAVSRRPRFASVVGASVLALLVAAAHLKVRFAGSRLTWYDVRFFFARFADNVGVMATQPTLLGCAGLVLLAVVACAWAGWRRDARRGDPGAGARWRVGAAVTAAVLLSAWTGRQLYADAQEQARLRGPWHLAQTRDATALPISRFLASAFLRPAWSAPMVDTRAFADAVRRRQADLGAPGARADIVLFLQESQFNPRTWKDCPAELCRFPVFEAGPDTVAYGPLRVHVFGGGTWLTEFTLATGVPHDAFGPGGSFAPFNIAPGTHRSFIRSLKAAGYRTVAVYPTGGGMMNGRLAYRAYGFDAFHDATDLGVPNNFFTPDAVMHAAALKVLAQERRHGQPVFLLALTIANHAEHGLGMQGVPPALVERAHAAFGRGREAENVADYVWRTQKFEDALTATRKVVLEGARPAVLAWFGDHQPPFGTALSLRARVQAAPVAGNRIPPTFQTWYQVSSNLPRKPGLAAPGTPLDIAFLPGVLAQAAGVPADDWIAANVTAREQCGGLLTECARPEVRDAYLTYLMRDLKAIELP